MAEDLSALEAIMWRVGQDPTLRMTIGALVLLDRPPPADALAERLAFAVEHAPRLALHPEDAPGLRSRQTWVEDLDPDPRRHLRTLSVAPPGSMRQVLDLVGLIEPVPFDPERSPWDVTVIDGVEGGRAAVYLRAHHVLTDGAGGIRLLGLLLDEARWPKTPLTPSEPEVRAEPAAAVGSQRRPGTVTVTATIDFPKAVDRLMGTLQAVREVDPVESAVQRLQRALDVANSVSRQLMVTGGPLTTRPAARSMLSRIEILSIDSARSAALTLGGSRNDLLVAASAAGVGLYYERLGESYDKLRVATPTSHHRGHEAGGNWFAPTRIEVPTAVGRPGPQFGVVVERLAEARQEPAVRVASGVAAAIRRMPTRLLLPTLRSQAETVDFAVTAVPGIRGERHMCGAAVGAVHPLGPRLGCPMNITAFGNDGRLDIGLSLDPAVVRDPEALIDCLREAFDGFGATSGSGHGAAGSDGPVSRRAEGGSTRPVRATSRPSSG